MSDWPKWNPDSPTIVHVDPAIDSPLGDYSVFTNPGDFPNWYMEPLAAAKKTKVDLNPDERELHYAVQEGGKIQTRRLLRYQYDRVIAHRSLFGVPIAMIELWDSPGECHDFQLERMGSYPIRTFHVPESD